MACDASLSVQMCEQLDVCEGHWMHLPKVWASWANGSERHIYIYIYIYIRTRRLQGQDDTNVFTAINLFKIGASSRYDDLRTERAPILKRFIASCRFIILFMYCIFAGPLGPGRVRKPTIFDSLIPWFLDSLIPRFLDSMIPWFLIPWFHASLIPWFHDSWIPWFHDSMIPCYLWNLYTRSGGCAWWTPLPEIVPFCDFSMSPGPLESIFFWPEQKCTPDPSKSASECSRHRFLSDFWRFLEAFWSHLVTFFLEKK